MKLFSARDKGQQIENEVLNYLQQQGLKLVARNFSSRHGEIDLIMRDQHDLVFIEVRFRRSTQFGTAIESINTQKQQRIIQTAMYYLQRYPHQASCRFDVVGVAPVGDKYHFDWIKNAFQC